MTLMRETGGGYENGLRGENEDAEGFKWWP
jgi:hypothetical protein